MRAKDLVVGESYRHKDTPSYAWARVVELLPPKRGDNPYNRIIVKCEWSVEKNDGFGLIKYFKPADLIAEV
ncbi:MAG TPA: hypothetical protein DCS09_08570 [Porphyromonadaceae bacterium]|nr:hypothetical protein [Porphyromonadaceae bacterium]